MYGIIKVLKEVVQDGIVLLVPQNKQFQNEGARTYQEQHKEVLKKLIDKCTIK